MTVAEKQAARAALTLALRNGTVVRAEACAECGSAARIQGHHEDYSQPLDVIWLCATCHRKRHRTNARPKASALGCLNGAIDTSGRLRGELAGDCCMTEGQLSRQASGMEGFPVALLDLLPDDLVIDFAQRLAEGRGVSLQARPATELQGDLLGLVERLVRSVRVQRGETTEPAN